MKYSIKVIVPLWLALISATALAQTLPGVAVPSVKKEKPAAPDSAVSFGNYLSGRFAESQGDTGHGVQFLQDSLKRDPGNLDMTKSLYRMLVLDGKIEEALPLARKLEGVKVVESGSEFSAEMLLALEAGKAGRYDEMDKRLAAMPKTGFNSLLVPLLRSWSNLGRKAIKAPLDAKALSPDGRMMLPHIYLNAALINDIAGYDKEAQKQYEAAVKDTRIEPFRAVEALANFYTRGKMDEKRTKLVDDYITAHGDSYLADELLSQMGDENKKPLVENATQGLAEVFYTIATIFHGVRAPADEVATLHMALYLRPDFPAAQFLMANAYELGQEFQKAEDSYKTIAKDSPYYARGRIRSAYDEIELNHKDAALGMLDDIARERPEDIDALLAKGDVLRAQNRCKEAIAAYDESLERVKAQQKHQWVIYFSRGACYQLENQWDKAEADMKKALELNPKEPEVLNYLGYSWLTMHRNIEDATKMIKAAYDARPDDAHIIDSMGYAMYVGRDFASAEEYFEQALERTPNDPTVNDHLGDTYWQLGRKTEARYSWERSLANNPDKDTEKEVRRKLKDGLPMLEPAPESKKASHPKPASITEN